MTVKLRRLDTQAVIELPENLYWSNYGEFNPIATDAQRSLQGTMIYQDFVPVGGEPVTISAPSDMDWAKRSIVNQLREWAKIPGLQLIAEISGGVTATLSVRFDYTKTPCIEANPVRGYDFPDPEDDFHLAIHLITL